MSVSFVLAVSAGLAFKERGKNVPQVVHLCIRIQIKSHSCKAVLRKLPFNESLATRTAKALHTCDTYSEEGCPKHEKWSPVNVGLIGLQLLVRIPLIKVNSWVCPCSWRSIPIICTDILYNCSGCIWPIKQWKGIQSQWQHYGTHLLSPLCHNREITDGCCKTSGNTAVILHCLVF